MARPRLSARQLLCALRDGPFGAEAANAAIERRLRQRWEVPASQDWMPPPAARRTATRERRSLPAQ